MRRALDAVASVVASIGADPPPQLVFSRSPLESLSPDDVGVVDLDGESPTTALLGALAPDEVVVVGTAAGGWAVDAEQALVHGRPSSCPDAVRVRTIVLLDRSGRGTSLLSVAGDEPFETRLPEGMATDVLRRVLDVPTPPPSVPVGEVAPGVESWADLRWLVLTHEVDVPGLPFELAAWMDDGIFSRWCLLTVTPRW